LIQRKLAEAAKNLDFTKAVKPELAEKARKVMQQLFQRFLTMFHNPLFSSSSMAAKAY